MLFAVHTPRRGRSRVAVVLLAALFAGWLLCRAAIAGDLPHTIALIKPSVVAVGTVQQTRMPPAAFRGTGFAVGNGSLVVTNAHVIPALLDGEHEEYLAVFVGRGESVQARSATQVAIDREHDLALLRISGKSLPPLTLGDSSRVREGAPMAFTGFPIGVVLGLYPVTHRAIVSAITPIAIPVHSARNLNVKRLKRLRSPFSVFQLDAIAYPGNSGSPLFDPKTGQVVGIVNAVFVKGSKENALSHPTGISYAIPGNYIRALLRRAGRAR